MDYSKAPDNYEWHQKYKIYLNSREWKNTRTMLFRQRGKQCELCGFGSSRLYIHHLTYERLGHERFTDLQIVCERCHEKADIQRVIIQSYIREGKRLNTAFNTWCDKRGIDEPDEYEYERFSNWLERQNE